MSWQILKRASQMIFFQIAISEMKIFQQYKINGETSKTPRLPSGVFFTILSLQLKIGRPKTALFTQAFIALVQK